ncbi:MAG: hypothetical protein ACYDAQ_01810 [Mycobacteriales bacterium]
MTPRPGVAVAALALVIAALLAAGPGRPARPLTPRLVAPANPGALATAAAFTRAALARAEGAQAGEAQAGGAQAGEARTAWRRWATPALAAALGATRPIYPAAGHLVSVSLVVLAAGPASAEIEALAILADPGQEPARWAVTLVLSLHAEAGRWLVSSVAP